MATNPSRGRRSSERLGWPVGVVLGGVVLVGLLGLGVSVAKVARPSTVQARSADAVMVHAGREARLDGGLELVEAGVAPVLVVSAVGSGYDRGNVAVDALCRWEEPFEVLCPVPEPSSTIGEARAFGRLAEQHGWETVAVVTSRGHLTRARLAVSQCTDAEVLPVAADSSPWVGTVAKEWLATGATTTLWRACW